MRLKAAFSVELRPDAEVDSVDVRMRVACPVIEDGSMGDDLELSMTTDVALTDDAERPGWKTFSLKQAEVAHFECETVPYDPMWTVRFVPEVESVEIGK